MKSNKLPAITVNEWLEAESVLRIRERPKNGKTRREYAQEKNLCISAAGERLRTMVAKGRISVVEAAAPCGGRINYYVPIKKEAHRPAAASSRSRRNNNHR